MATAWPTVWRLSESSEGRGARVKGRRHDKSTIPPNLASPHDGGIGNHNAGTESRDPGQASESLPLDSRRLTRVG